MGKIGDACRFDKVDSFDRVDHAPGGNVMKVERHPQPGAVHDEHSIPIAFNMIDVRRNWQNGRLEVERHVEPDLARSIKKKSTPISNIETFGDGTIATLLAVLRALDLEIVVRRRAR